IRTIFNTDRSSAWGMHREVSVDFEASRAFSVGGHARFSPRGKDVDVKPVPKPDVAVIANYATSDLLMSGEALGAKKYIGGKPAMVRVPYGKGQIILFAFRPQFRGQPRDTFKLIFNAIYNATMDTFPGTS